MGVDLVDELPVLAPANVWSARAVPTPLQAPRLFERALVRGLADTEHASVAHNCARSSAAHARCASACRPSTESSSTRSTPISSSTSRPCWPEDEGPCRGARRGRCAGARGDAPGGDHRGADRPHDARRRLAAAVGGTPDRAAGDAVACAGPGLRAACARGRRRLHAACLRLFDSLITYRAQFQARREVLPLLHLLVQDTDTRARSPGWRGRCATACAKLAAAGAGMGRERERRAAGARVVVAGRARGRPTPKASGRRWCSRLQECTEAARACPMRSAVTSSSMWASADRRVRQWSVVAGVGLAVRHETRYDTTRRSGRAPHRQAAPARRPNASGCCGGQLTIDPEPDAPVQCTRDAFATGGWDSHAQVHEVAGRRVELRSRGSAPPPLQRRAQPAGGEGGGAAAALPCGRQQPGAVEFMLGTPFAPHDARLARLGADLFTPRRPLLDACSR